MMFPFLIIIVVDIIIIIISDCECQVRLLWSALAAFHRSVYANCAPPSHLLLLEPDCWSRLWALCHCHRWDQYPRLRTSCMRFKCTHWKLLWDSLQSLPWNETVYASGFRKSLSLTSILSFRSFTTNYFLFHIGKHWAVLEPAQKKSGYGFAL